MNEEEYPRVCKKCGCTELEYVIKNTEQGHIAEEEIICTNCGNEVAYYAYGFYQIH